MKKIFKDYNYLSMILGTVISLVSMITCFFVESRTYFTIMFVVNIVINFCITALILLLRTNATPVLRFKYISLYLLVTLFLLIMDVTIISNFWNLNVYSNLMYITNIKLYLGMYSIFVLIMVLMSIYVVLKDITDNEKIRVRQKSSKQ